MNEKAPFKAISSKLTKATAAAGIVIVLPLPGEVNNQTAVTLAEPAVEPPADRTELKMAHLLMVELDERGDDQVEVFRIPHLHLSDAPIPCEGSRSTVSAHSPSSANGSALSGRPADGCLHRGGSCRSAQANRG